MSRAKREFFGNDMPVHVGRLGAALVLWGAAVVWPLAAGEPADVSAVAEAKVRAALAQPASFDFVDTPLADVAAYLADHYQINVRVDMAALNEAGVDAPITAQLSNISTRSALRLMLEPLDLAAVVHEGVLFITTKDEADAMRVTRVYPAADFLLHGVDDFVAAVTTAIAPDSWAEEGGSGRVLAFGDQLIVTQNEEVHRAIEILLRDLRAAAERAQVAQSAPQAVGVSPAAHAASAKGKAVRCGANGQCAADAFVELLRGLAESGSGSNHPNPIAQD